MSLRSSEAAMYSILLVMILVLTNFGKSLCYLESVTEADWLQNWSDRMDSFNWSYFDDNFDLVLSSSPDQTTKELLEKWHEVCNPLNLLCADSRYVLLKRNWETFSLWRKNYLNSTPTYINKKW